MGKMSRVLEGRGVEGPRQGGRRIEHPPDVTSHPAPKGALNETKVSVANKLSRGTFSASFFFAAMKAIWRETVNLADV
jgi:hypothetical protein